MEDNFKLIDLSQNNDQRLNRRIQEDEKELAELETQRNKELGLNQEDQPEPQDTPDGAIPTNEEELTPEEKTYKKRYGDLRKYSADRENELRRELGDLKKQISEITNTTNNKLPVNEDQLNAWMQEFPHLAKVVQGMIAKGQQETHAEFKKVTDNLENMKHQAAKMKAYNEVLAAHPDLPQIVNDERYDAWLATKSKYIVDSLVHNETDPSSAIESLNFFKLETGYGKKPRKQADREAAVKSPSGNGAPVIADNEKKYIRESDVEKMNDREYLKWSDEIDKAMREGRFIRDLSGGAR